jgi:NADPH-dependent 2,4-dienoyl-CoA reductase/sulfur reductase-like enzyme
MSEPARRIVVVGGSIAAVEAATTLRRLGFEGELTVVSEEVHPPYSRVPLSKGILAGAEPLHSAAIAGADDGIDLRCGVRAAGLDSRRHVVHLDGGPELPYDRVIVATGARARRLTTNGLALRTLDDCITLRSRLAAAARVVVIGGGFLGMEIASTCLDLGLDTTVVDRDPPLVRLAGPLLAERVARSATERGLRVVTAPVAAVGPGEVRLAGGGTLRGDVVVEAVGDVPNVEWLAGSGLRLDGGLVVDGRCRAGVDVLAAGDVAVLAGRPRMPHWTNALEQARAAAATALHGLDAPEYSPSGYYWTEQFGVSLRVVGELPPRGLLDPLDGDGLLSWRDGSAVTTVAAVNHRAPVARMRRLLSPAGTAPAPSVPAS